MNVSRGTKSHVAMEQHQCTICGDVFDTGAILLNKQLRQTLDSHVLTGNSPCPACATRLKEGFVAMIVVEDAAERPDNKYTRTGDICWLRATVFQRMFDQPATAKVVYIPPNLFETLTLLTKERQHEPE